MRFTHARGIGHVLAMAASVMAGFMVGLPVAIGAHDLLPIISILTPTQNQTVGGYVRFYVSSDSAGVVGLRFQIDGQNFGSEIVSGACIASWDTRQANDGLHTIQAVGRDQYGNVTLAQPVTVLVSNPVYVPPPAPAPTPLPGTLTVTITAPIAGATVSGKVPVSATFPSGTLFLSYVLRDPVTSVTRWVARGPDLTQTKTSESFLADMSAVPPGAYDLLVVSQRAEGDVISARVAVNVAAPLPPLTMTLATMGSRIYILAAIVKFKGVPVPGIPVAFVVKGPTGTKWTFSVATDALGLAMVQKTLALNAPRGTYQVTSSATTAGVTVTASGTFTY
jgi:hypothetical protein